MLTSTKPPKCKVCRIRLEQRRPGQIVHEGCVEKWLETVRAKREAAAKKQERAATRAQKEAAKGLRQLLAEAQEAFNEWIRARDADCPCIACGDPFEPNKPGGSMDAGHFRARSIAPQLRFNEDNCFGQHKNCNRPGGTTYARFRLGVEGRIGLVRLLAVEADNTVHKWTKEEVRQIRDDYRARNNARRNRKE